MYLTERLARAYHAFVSPEPEIEILSPEVAKGQGVGTPPQVLHPWSAQSFAVPVGYNTQTTVRSNEAVTAATLRAIAKNCDLVRLAIKMLKDQLRGLEWDITPVHDVMLDETLRARQKKIREFFRRPDPMNDIGFHDWLGAWLEDLLVLDAPTLLVIRDRANRLVALPQIDGATIIPRLDENGFVPQSPGIAYQQVISGEVHSNLTRDQLLYTPYNVQPNSPFGLSPVEMVRMAAHIALQRELSALAYHTDGSVPDYLIVAPKNWTGEQIITAQRLLDTHLSGNWAARHRMKLVPGEFDPKPMKTPDFTVQLDEWLARIIHGIFGTAPHLLLRQRTKQQAGALESQQTYLGQKPLTKFICEIFTERIIRREFSEPRLQFSFTSDKRDEEEFNLARATAMIPLGVIGIDDILQSEGKQPIGIPRYIQFPNGALFLNANVLASLKSGKVDYIDASGVGRSLDDPPPAPVVPQKPPAEEKPAPDGKKPPVDEGKKELIVGELKKWRQCVLADLKRGVPVREFKCEYIPEPMAYTVRGNIEALGVPEDVKAFLDKFIEYTRTNAV